MVQLLPVRFLSTATLPNISRCSSPAISKSGTNLHSDTLPSCLQSEDQPRSPQLAAEELNQIALPMGERQEWDTPLQTSLNSCLMQESIRKKRVYSFFWEFLEQPPAGSSRDTPLVMPSFGYFQTALIAYSFYLTLFLKMFLAILFFHFITWHQISLKSPKYSKATYTSVLCYSPDSF